LQQEEDEEDGFSQDEEVHLIVGSVSAEAPESFKAPTRRLLQTTLTNVIRRDALSDSDANSSGSTTVPWLANPAIFFRRRVREVSVAPARAWGDLASSSSCPESDELASESDKEVIEITNRQLISPEEHEDPSNACQLEEEVRSPPPESP
jgi:hypothetical protein